MATDHGIGDGDHGDIYIYIYVVVLFFPVFPSSRGFCFNVVGYVLQKHLSRTFVKFCWAIVQFLRRCRLGSGLMILDSLLLH